MSKRKDRERAEKGVIFRNGQLVPKPPKILGIDEIMEARRPIKYRIKKKLGQVPLPD